VLACHRENVEGKMEVADPSKVLVSSRVLGITSQKMVQSLLYILIPMVDFSGGIK